MLSQSLGPCFGQFYLSLKAFNPSSLAIFILVLWLIWRVWTFTIIPKLRPQDPVVLPYALPLIGHTISWLWNRTQLVENGGKRLPGDFPFALYIGGKRLIVIRTPDGIKAMWNDPKSFTFDFYMIGIIEAFGISPSRYSLAFEDNPAKLWKGGDSDAPHFVKENPAKRRLVSLQEKWMKDALQPGAKMEAVSKIFMEHIKHLVPVYVSDPRVAVAGSRNDGDLVNLVRWGRYVLADAGTKAFLGPEIFDIDPDFVQNYLDWEDLSWKIPYGHPKFLSKDLFQAEEVLVQPLMKYFALDPTQRPNLNWLFDFMQSDQRKIGLTAHDTAASAIIMLWAVHLNPGRLFFWTLTHILCSPSLTQKIRDETNLAFDLATNTFSISHLMNSCPLATATWHEALRLYASSSVVRTCESTTVIGDKTIKAGDRLMSPLYFVHRSPHIWGDDAQDFNEQRWLKEGFKTPKGYYPFGGGHMHCPGRFLAKQEVFLFIATVLREWDIEPVGEKIQGGVGGEVRWKVPKEPKKHAGAGVSDANEDFLVRITKRYN
ncbi:cytochrome P450 [Cadophora sp. MPI-SDFR-AT-0126]|nr:cytochrome P450 [Leotiomycetes sp. MPI-SDFR-AT-0126]